MPMNDAGGEICPACGCNASFLMNWDFSGLGDSIFNYTADYFCCKTCGLVYVQNIDDRILSRFYVEECSYFDKSHFSVKDPANQEKYAYYSRFLADAGIADANMADVGCGRGGFVNWLAQHGWLAPCLGVDVDVRSLPESATGGVAFRAGDVLHLPFEDQSQELLTYFHVLEHIHDLDGLLGEAARVLVPGGHILVEVPDAENYAAKPIGTAFWISIREHIHHFTARALDEALRRHGFQVSRVARQILPTPEFSYPSLMILAGKTGHTGGPQPEMVGDVAAFTRHSREALLAQAGEINTLAQGRSLTLWGCSAELFSLLPLLDAGRIRICDSSRLKQSTRYRGVAIEDPAAVPVEGILVIAPYLHAAAIRAAALDLGWPEDALYLLQ